LLDDDDDEMKEISSTTMHQVTASLVAEPDITSLQSHCLLDGAAGVELNRIGLVSLSDNTLAGSPVSNELDRGIRERDVPLLDPTAEHRNSLNSLDMDCDEDVALLIPDCNVSYQNTASSAAHGKSFS